MATSFWICREDNMVVAASVAALTRPEDLKKWRDGGMKPELVAVASGSISVPAPMPYDATVIQPYRAAPGELF